MDLFLIKHRILYPFFYKGFDFSVSDFALTAFGVPMLLFYFFYLGAFKGVYVPSALQNLVEIAYESCKNIFYAYLGEKGKHYISFLFSLMLFLFILNICNLIPGLFACTNQLALTFTLALIVFILIICIGFFEHGIKFFLFFIPNGLPMLLKPFMFVLELISFFIRPISLALRLTINMIAGHIMLHIINSFSASSIGLSNAVTIAILSILSIFEIAVAGLQAYVFAVLSCIYIADILHGHDE